MGGQLAQEYSVDKYVTRRQNFIMKIDEKISTILEKLNGSPKCPLRTEIPGWFKGADKVDDLELEIIIHTLLKEELAFEKNGEFHITRRGRKIKESGGWKKFVDKEDLEEKRKLEKADYDLKNSKYLVKVQWWPIIISVVGLFISVRTCTRADDKLSTDTKIEQNQPKGHGEQLIEGKGDTTKVSTPHLIDSVKNQ